MQTPQKNNSLKAIRSLSWQSLAYGMGLLGSQLIVYLMIPFLTRYMSQEEYGTISVLTAFYGFLNMLTNAGLPSATFKYFNEKEDKNDQTLTIGSSQFLFFSYAFVPALFIVFFAPAFSLWLLGDVQFSSSLRFLAIYLLFDSLITFGNVILRIEVRPIVSSIQSILYIAFRAAFSLLFVISYDMGANGYWLGNLLGSILGLASMFWFIRKRITFNISKARILDLAKFGTVLIPTTLSMTILRMADRYIIGSISGLEQVAIYDVGYKIGSVILFLIIPFRTAWIPFAFSISKKPEMSRVYRDVFTYLMAGCSFLILAIIAFQHEILNLTAPDSYSGAAIIVAIVAASHIFLAAYHVFSVGPMIMNKADVLAWGALASGGINIALNYILIPRIGILGAAIATFVSYLFMAVQTYFVSTKFFTSLIDLARIMKMLLIIAIISAGIYSTSIFEFPTGMVVLLKIFLLLMFPAGLFLAGFIKVSQIQEIMKLRKGSATKENIEFQ